MGCVVAPQPADAGGVQAVGIKSGTKVGLLRGAAYATLTPDKKVAQAICIKSFRAIASPISRANIWICNIIFFSSGVLGD
jgi:hypothetical protein